MPIIDIQLITRKIKIIEEDLDRLSEYKNISYKDYLKDFKIQLVVERLLERITGRMIDINYHILREGHELLPEDYYNSFIEMGKNKIVSSEFAQEIAKSAGLRNALAHEYEEINPKLVHGAIKTALTQVPQYLKTVLDFVSK